MSDCDKRVAKLARFCVPGCCPIGSIVPSGCAVTRRGTLFRSRRTCDLGIPVIAYSHGGVKEQLIKLLPKGLIEVGIINDVINLALRWIAEPPKIKKNNFFTLNKMLQNTLNVYEKVIKEKGEASVD